MRNYFKKRVKMKLNKSFFNKAVLIITLFVSPTLSVQAKEVTNYAQNHSSKSYSQVLVAAANKETKGHGAKDSDQGFVSKRTTAMEFTFALVAVVGGLIASDRYQRIREKQQILLGESNENDLAIIDE